MLGVERVRLSVGGRFENPVLEPGLKESRAVTGAEGALVEFDAPVRGGGIDDDLAGSDDLRARPQIYLVIRNISRRTKLTPSVVGSHSEDCSKNPAS
jgi:hypothetical protein